MPLPQAAFAGWIIGSGIRYAGKTIIKRPLLSAGGAILGWELFDLDDTKIGSWTEEKFGAILDELLETGANVVNGGIDVTGGFILEAIEKGGPAVLTGVENTFIALRETLRGREVGYLTTFTVVVLTILTARFLWNASATAGRTIFE
tara:strand:- start:1239 stop:1679 length:441 start_codon:yes stop_codon:yes gene_type:complete